MMSESEIKKIISHKLNRALKFHNDPLSRDRINALKYYRGDKFGNETEGSSQVVSRDVAEVVDTLLPSLMRVFASGDRAVIFEPVGQEDQEIAEQATDYANHIWNSDNPGFQIFHTWFKDALVQRNGVVKVWWEKKARSAVLRYQGLTDEQLAALTEGDDQIEVLEQNDTQAESDLDPATGAPTVIVLHDVTLRRTWQDGRVCVRNVPPEEFVIDLTNPNLDEDTTFCAHRFRKTISELIGEGYDKKLVDQIPRSEGDDLSTNEEATERQQPEMVDAETSLSDTLDQSMREVWVSECYLKIDTDKDGRAELRKITVAGDEADIILDNEEVDDNCFAAICPYPMPHKFYGESLADKTRDIQELKSAIWRQSLDNLYLTNTPQKVVVMSQLDKGGMDDLLTPRIGGFIRAKSADAVTPIQPQVVYQHGLKSLEYVDTVREARTGITKYNQGLDADTLNKTARGINAIMGAAHMREELIARIFAETGVTRAFKLVLKNVIKYQERKRVIRMRNKWVEIDPKYWNADMDVSVSVGLGTGNKDQQLAHLSQLLAIQKEIIVGQGGMTGPLVNGKNLYNTLAKYIQAADLKNVEPYFTDPETAPPAEPKPDPKMAEAQQKAEIESAKAAHAAKLAAQKQEHDLALAQQKTAAEIELSRAKADAEIALQRERQHGEMEMGKERMRGEMEMGRERQRTELEHKAKGLKLEEHMRGILAGELPAPEGPTPEEQRHQQMMVAVSEMGRGMALMAEGLKEMAAQIARPVRLVRDAGGRTAGAERV